MSSESVFRAFNLSSAALWACVFLAAVTLASAQDYTVTKFPTLGGKLTRAFAINDQGQVVGVSGLADNNSHAFLWSRIGGIEDLGTLGGPSSGANGISPAGEVVGSAADSTGSNFAFSWTPAGGMKDLGALGFYSNASSVNNADEVVGSTQVGSGNSVHAFLWTLAGGMQDLGTLPGGTLGSFASGINRSGQVVGSSYTADNSLHAFLWTQAGGMQDLGTLGGSNSFAAAVNNNGQVVGYSDTSTSGVQHAFLWSPAHGMQDLGVLPGFTNSSASGITAAGIVVGSCSQGSSGSPFRWTKSGGMMALGPFGNVPLTNADGINSAGLILASYYTGTSGYSSYLLTPTMNTTLVSSINPAAFGQQIIFTATVTSTVVGPPPDGEIVSFEQGSTVLGTGTLKSGVATFSISTLAVGTESIKAVYAGDANFPSSTSKAVTQVVDKATTTSSLLSSPNPSSFNQAVTFTATVTPQFSGVPTGTVTFKNGTGTIATVTMSGGVAAFAKSNLAVGTAPITAVYSGSSSFFTSTSPVLNQVVNPAATTTTLTSSPNPSNFGQPVTFTATLVAQFGGTVTGTVTLMDGTTLLKTVTLSSGVARYTTSSLASGTHNITATYNGSTDYSASSAALTQTVN